MMKNDISAHASYGLRDAMAGVLLGGMVGDALGLPYEGLSRKRVRRLTATTLKHRFVWGYGMVSDDTEHTVAVALSLAAYWQDAPAFERALGWRLRWWFARLPAGVGMATARAIIKLWLGFSPARSGVYSAGNGPAMRAAIIGVALGAAPLVMKDRLRRSTLMTHSDPKAYVAALAVAQAAYISGIAKEVTFDCFEAGFKGLLAGEDNTAVNEFLSLLKAVKDFIDKPVDDFTAALGLSCGVSGYSYHTVPVVLLLWFKYPNDYEKAISEVIRLGGDTDTAAAILGGIIGAGVGKAGIPKDWLNGVKDWPINAKELEGLAGDLAVCVESGRSHQLNKVTRGPFLLVRNLVFLCVVLLHGFRRLLPF